MSFKICPQTKFPTDKIPQHIWNIWNTKYMEKHYKLGNTFYNIN